MGPGFWSALEPATVEDRVTLFQLIRDELETRAAGLSTNDVPRLALIATEHIAGDAGAHVVLRGPSSKSFLCRTLGEILDLPVLSVHCGLTAEQNWSGGADLTTTIDQLQSLIARRPPAIAQRIAAKAIVVLEDFDQTKLAGSYDNASTRNYRQGKQNGFAALLKGEPIPGTGPGTKWWSAKNALVIVNGRFDGLRHPAAAGDYADWGTIPALAEQLARADTFLLEPPSGPALERIIRGMTAGLADRFEAFGFMLRIAPEAISYLVCTMASMNAEGGVQQARACLDQAAAALLLDALGRSLPPGEVVTLAPDHIVAPPAARGMWRE